MRPGGPAAMTTPPRRRILPRLEAPASPPRQLPVVPVLNEDILEDILLRVASPTDLARATAACTSFRRLITDPSFLRRHRSLYPPLLLGIFCDGIQPAAPPHPNARAARSLANHSGFSFHYLPGESWQLCDVRDGRVLLECLLKHDEGSVFFSPELAVCDPVHRCFRLLPPIPQDLIAHVQVQGNKARYFEAFLVPSGHQEETSFKVIGRTHCEEKLAVFVFSSDSNLWSVGTSTNWADLGLTTPPDVVLGWSQYEHGCFYCKIVWRNKLLKLDMDRMEFSTVDLPPGDNDEREVAIVEEGEEGRLGLFTLPRDGASVYYFTGMKSEEEIEWLVENTILLPCNCNIVGAFEGYIFLQGVQEDQGRVAAVCFSLEIKTLKIERINSVDILFVHNLPYFGYPPFMSPKRIE